MHERACDIFRGPVASGLEVRVKAAHQNGPLVPMAFVTFVPITSAAGSLPTLPALSGPSPLGRSSGAEQQSSLPAAAAVAALAAASAVGRRKGARSRVQRAATEVGRRGGVLAGLAAAAAVARPKPAVAAEKLTKQTAEKAQADIEQIIKADPNKGPTLVRLAWHSSGSYDKVSKTGGSGPGTIRFKEELAHGGNAGLDKAVAWLEPVKQSNPSISYADLYTLAGVTCCWL